MNSLSFSIVWTWMIYVKITMTAWTISPHKLPQGADDELATGAYNGTIFILGAYNEPRQLTTYEIATDTWSDLGTTALSQDINGGEGQYWTQQDHIIYMINADFSRFNIYNMITNQYTTNWSSITFNIEVQDSGCLASDSQYLYITGGKSNNVEHNELQIISLSTKEWLIDPPSMKEPQRDAHSCLVHNDYLWVFGGDGAIQVATNERISIIDITHNIWNFIDPLTVALEYVRSVAWIDIIYVIGGNDGSEPQDIIHLVDVNTGTVITSPDFLPLPQDWGSPIIVDAVLYTFGGFEDKNKDTDNWAYYPLPPPPTSGSTLAPSKYPSSSPSNDPTVAPSTNPTMPTTANPTSSPSKNPTPLPSTHPTALPSSNPTMPTSSPSNNPTSSPSGHPSTVPTINPTVNPTSNPTSNTVNPTINPSLHPTLTLIFKVTAPETQYTISITLNECTMDGGECDIDKDKINNILIAYIDDVQILSTEIVDNRISIVISIQAHEDNVLDKDVITKGIKNELEVEYGDVDVTIKETQDEDEKQENTKVFSDLYIVITAIIITVLCVIIGSCIYYYFKTKKMDQEEKHTFEAMGDNVTTDIQSEDALSDNIIPGIDTEQKEDIITDTKADIVFNKDTEDNKDDDDIKDKDTDSDSLYDNGSPVLVTPGLGFTKGELDHEDNPENGSKDSGDSESLYIKHNEIETPNTRTPP